MGGRGFWVLSCWSGISGLGFRVWGQRSGFRVQGQGLGFRVRVRLEGSGFRVRFRV